MKLEDIKTGDYIFYTERPHSNYADALVHIRNVDGVNMAHTVCVNCAGRYMNEDVSENWGYDIPVSAYFDEKCWHPTGYKEEYGSPAAWMSENFPLERGGCCWKEIANCPLCGVIPSIRYGGILGKKPVSYRHCGAEFETIGLWNKYAAAMELARVTFCDCTDLARDRAMSAYWKAFK